MFANFPRWCGSLVLAGLGCLAVSAAPPATSPDDDIRKQHDTPIYRVYYREAASEPWYYYLPYTSLADAEKGAKKFKDEGCETVILEHKTKQFWGEKQGRDPVYKLYSRPTVADAWAEVTVYTTLLDAEKAAKALREKPGVETYIRKYESK